MLKTNKISFDAAIDIAKSRILDNATQQPSICESYDRTKLVVTFTVAIPFEEVMIDGGNLK